MPTRYAIRHTTRFTYAGAVSESVMELRMRPATAGHQRCLRFEVDLQPRARVFAYEDASGNWVHHFGIPRRHALLTITARSQVEIDPLADLPEALPPSTWSEVDAWITRSAHWDYRQPSQFAVWSDALVAFADALGPIAERTEDPLTTARRVMHAIHDRFEYAPKTTRVDSPIDEALAATRGVCQDFSHVMIAVLRRIGLPTRYVSGYIAPSAVAEREPSTIATHAWVEVCLPELGWIGFDPTHDITAGLRHVRVAIGRDYADVPPTRGIFKGGPASDLSVSVEVTPGDTIPTLDPAVLSHAWAAAATAEEIAAERQAQQQQQQQ